MYRLYQSINTCRARRNIWSIFKNSFLFPKISLKLFFFVICIKTLKLAGAGDPIVNYFKYLQGFKIICILKKFCFCLFQNNITCLDWVYYFKLHLLSFTVKCLYKFIIASYISLQYLQDSLFFHYLLFLFTFHTKKCCR